MIIIKMTIKNVKTVKLRLLNDIFKSFYLFALHRIKKYENISNSNYLNERIKCKII